MRFNILAIMPMAIIGIFFGQQAYALDVTGLNNPESVIVDKKTGDYYISNVNGDSLAKDNNGYISKISSDELVVVLEFIHSKDTDSELNAPKGMVIFENWLYVSDIDVVRAYDLTSGEEMLSLSFDEFEPKHLNDIALDESQGILYVGDMLTNRIFSIDAQNSHEIRLFYSGEDLGKPNGLFFDSHANELLIATWDTGQVLTVDGEGAMHEIKTGLSPQLDGLFIDRRGDLYVSSFSEGEIYKISKKGRGTLSLHESGLTTPADISYNPDKDELIIPYMTDNRVSSISLSSLPS